MLESITIQIIVAMLTPASIIIVEPFSSIFPIVMAPRITITRIAARIKGSIPIIPQASVAIGWETINAGELEVR